MNFIIDMILAGGLRENACFYEKMTAKWVSGIMENEISVL